MVGKGGKEVDMDKGKGFKALGTSEDTGTALVNVDGVGCVRRKGHIGKCRCGGC